VNSANICECQFCVSCKKNGDLSANTCSSELWEKLLYRAKVCSVNKCGVFVFLVQCEGKRE